MAKRGLKRERRAQIYIVNPLTNAQIKKLTTNAKRGGPIDVVDRRDFNMTFSSPFSESDIAAAKAGWDAHVADGWVGEEPTWETIRRVCRRKRGQYSAGVQLYREGVPTHKILSTFDGTNPETLVPIERQELVIRIPTSDPGQ